MAEANAAPAPVNRRCLMNGIEKLHKSGDYSDLVIECGMRQWKVHKSIVCTQCPFLEKAVRHDWQEAKSGIIKLDDDHQDAVHQLVDFLYTSEYDDKFCMTSASPHGPMQFDVKMFAIADKYDVPDLAALAQKKFIARMGRYSGERDFFRSVHELYERAPYTASKMRESTVSAAISQSNVLFMKKQEELIKSEDFQELVKEVPTFGAEVIVALTGYLKEQCERHEELAERLVQRGKELDTKVFDQGKMGCEVCDVEFFVTKTKPDFNFGCPYCGRPPIHIIEDWGPV